MRHISHKVVFAREAKHIYSNHRVELWMERRSLKLGVLLNIGNLEGQNDNYCQVFLFLAEWSRKNQDFRSMECDETERRYIRFMM